MARTYRIPEFLIQARPIHAKIIAGVIGAKEEARALCEVELAWIYATYKGTSPHAVVNSYRKALREAGLNDPWCDRYVQLMEDGQPVTKIVDGTIIQVQAKMRGYMSEYQDQVDARFAHDRENIDERTTYSSERELLVGKEMRYLQEAKRLLESFNWLEVAVGLLMSTGRRNFETAEQGTMVPVVGESHWVVFSGQAKKPTAEERDEPYKLAVLVNAPLVCKQWQHVQEMIAKVRDDTKEFDQDIGIQFRHAVERCLRPLFPTAPELNPRMLRNCHIALALEGIDTQGTSLVGDEDPEKFIGRMLGHKKEFRARDAYKRFVQQRQPRNFPLP